MKIGGADFSDAADLVLMQQAARVSLREGVLAVVELPDRQGEWPFTRHCDVIRVPTRYATREGWRFRPAEGKCQIGEFDNLVAQAPSDALALIFSTQPATRRNPHLQGLACNGFEAA